MNYHNITHDDLLNGEGVRVVLWVSGCFHHCYKCQNQQTWNPNSGILFDDNAKKEIFLDLRKDYITGITFSGGDPLNENNIATVLSLAKEIKENFPDKTIWVYSGYTMEEIVADTKGDIIWEQRKDLILNYTDVFCDGRFMEHLLNVNKPWVGSSNQKVINIKDWKERNIT